MIRDYRKYTVPEFLRLADMGKKIDQSVHLYWTSMSKTERPILLGGNY